MIALPELCSGELRKYDSIVLLCKVFTYLVKLFFHKFETGYIGVIL